MAKSAGDSASGAGRARQRAVDDIEERLDDAAVLALAQHDDVGCRKNLGIRDPHGAQPRDRE